jgi:hypothetical protein
MLACLCDPDNESGRYGGELLANQGFTVVSVSLVALFEKATALMR